MRSKSLITRRHVSLNGANSYQIRPGWIKYMSRYQAETVFTTVMWWPSNDPYNLKNEITVTSHQSHRGPVCSTMVHLHSILVRQGQINLGISNQENIFSRVNTLKMRSRSSKTNSSFELLWCTWIPNWVELGKIFQDIEHKPFYWSDPWKFWKPHPSSDRSEAAYKV